MAVAPPTLAVWLETHPWDNPDTTVPTAIANAYDLNAGENVLADITITDTDHNPIPAADVNALVVAIRRGEAPLVSWDQDSDQIDIEDGHIFVEIAKADTEVLAGLYDFYVQLSVADSDFFFSTNQTDVKEFQGVLYVRAALVNPAP
jgi:hypothetical protein